MSPAPVTLPPHKLDPLAAVLSYLFPGLGQVMQGRVGKGVLFFVCLYGLFFYGLWMGKMQNVWLPDVSGNKAPEVDLPLIGKAGGLAKAVYYRPQFLGQFWIGAAAWPAVVQHRRGVPGADADDPPANPAPVIGRYMQAPSEAELNKLQRDGDKRWDLGWVYTVIAGVLNVLVIYDALAGPVIRDDQPFPGTKPPPPPPAAAPVPAPTAPPVRFEPAVAPAAVPAEAQR